MHRILRLTALVLLLLGTVSPGAASADPAPHRAVVIPTVWPNDGIVATSSAVATDISDRVLPHRQCLSFDDTHSIFVSDGLGLPWDTGLTWDPRVLDTVHAAIEGAPGALAEPTRQGCPPAG